MEDRAERDEAEDCGFALERDRGRDHRGAAVESRRST
jgi:hypothetical protein